MAPRCAERSLRILLIEDEVILAIDMQDRLEQLGHQVVGIAGSVAKANSLLDAEIPDATILDVNLKGESSAPVARRLKRESVPCLVVSAYGSSEIPEPELRVLPNFRKPVSDDQLARACRLLLSQAA